MLLYQAGHLQMSLSAKLQLWVHRVGSVGLPALVFGWQLHFGIGNTGRLEIVVVDQVLDHRRLVVLISLLEIVVKVLLPLSGYHLGLVLVGPALA